MTFSIVPALKARVLAVEFIKNNPRLKALVDHPAGPFTSESNWIGLVADWTGLDWIELADLTHLSPPHPQTPAVHFWAPSFKWGISLANIADYNRPPELISVPQQCGES